MMSTSTLVLQSCPDHHRATVCRSHPHPVNTSIVISPACAHSMMKHTNYTATLHFFWKITKLTAGVKCCTRPRF